MATFANPQLESFATLLLKSVDLSGKVCILGDSKLRVYTSQ